MNDLLNFVLEAHGGLKRWSRVESVTVTASITGEIWQTKSKPGLSEERYLQRRDEKGARNAIQWKVRQSRTRTQTRLTE